MILNWKKFIQLCHFVQFNIGERNVVPNVICVILKYRNGRLIPNENRSSLDMMEPHIAFVSDVILVQTYITLREL